MKPAVYLYGVPGQYENYLAALESAGARVVLMMVDLPESIRPLTI